MISRFNNFLMAALLIFSFAAVGCSKDDESDVVELWRGNYSAYGLNDDGDYVSLTYSIMFLLQSDFSVTKQTLVYDDAAGTELVESLSTVKYGTYSRTATKLILAYDDCDCTEPCLCTHEDYFSEIYYYRYTYYEDEDYDEDYDDEAEDNSYGKLELRLYDEDDPYTEWIEFRYLEWVD